MCESLEYSSGNFFGETPWNIPNSRNSRKYNGFLNIHHIFPYLIKLVVVNNPNDKCFILS